MIDCPFAPGDEAADGRTPRAWLTASAVRRSGFAAGARSYSGPGGILSSGRYQM